MTGRTLDRNERGAAAVEFALVITPLLILLFGILITALYFWERSAVQRAAFEGARCAAINDSACADATAIKAYAVTVAGQAGVTITADQVAVALDTQCDGLPSMVSVTITKTMANPAPGLLPTLPAELTGTSCLPEINRD